MYLVVLNGKNNTRNLQIVTLSLFFIIISLLWKKYFIQNNKKERLRQGVKETRLYTEKCIFYHIYKILAQKNNNNVA